MELSKFKIGDQFWTRTGRWQVTDIGTRVLVGIKYPQDQRNLNGPPYSVAETTFDEYDLEVLHPDFQSLLGEYRDMGDQATIDELTLIYDENGEFKNKEN